MKNIELRMNSFNVIDNDQEGKLTVQGYVNETGKESHLLGDRKKFKETISKGAFTRALAKGNDIHFLAEHDENKILASTRNGSLTLKEDDKGLLMKADISDTTYGRDYHTLIKDGILRNMSFGFTVDKDKWSKDKDGTYKREVNDLTLYEVSVVTNPAYPQSTISARGLNIIEDVEIPNIEERACVSGVWDDKDILNIALNIIGDVSTLLQHNKKSDTKVLDTEVEQAFNEMILNCSEIISDLNETVGNKDDEISMVRYLYIDAYDDFDIKLSDKEGAYYRYILNGISFIVEDVQFETQNAHRVDEVLVKNKVELDKIKGIQISDKYKDALLEDLFYFPMSKYYENIKNISEDYIRYMASYGYEVNINEYKNLINELRYTYNALIDASKEDIEDLEDDYEDVLADLNEYMAQNISACFRKKLGYDITLYDLVIFLRNKNKVNLPIYIIPYTREKGKAK